MVSVAYMDPGNYSTAVAAGSAYQYKLLFSILLSNCLAVFLQILAAKLGAVTGLDLAANCRENLSPRLNMFIYVLAEIAIIATDLAEVVGTAIALNILFNIPLFAGVLLTVVDVIVVLMAYRPDGPILFVRLFESFVSLLVLATVVCFAVELAQVAKEPNFSFTEVFLGFLPSEEVIDTDHNGLYLSLAILGATVMPHSLYLGSGLVQTRLKDYDIKHGYYIPQEKETRLNQKDDSLSGQQPLMSDFADNTMPESPTESPTASNPTNYDSSTKNSITSRDSETPDAQIVAPVDPYRPSIHAIKNTISYTIVELIISLFTVALFVNATILIVAGATMGHGDSRDDDSDDEDESEADLFTIYRLLTIHLSPTAGTVFALALLCSGQSAGVVCTLAGQMVLEGFLNWSFSPVVRRLVTRALAITPCMFVVVFLGKESLAQTLNALQVVLSVLLPVVTAPLIYFTCSKKIMRVPMYERESESISVLSDHSHAETLRTFLHEEGRPTHRFEATEPAIRLQTLRKAHPCAGWEDNADDEDHQQHFDQQILWQNTEIESPRLSRERHNSDALFSDEETVYLKGHSDMSNGPITTFFAILTWGFVTCLNLYLVVSVLWD